MKKQASKILIPFLLIITVCSSVFFNLRLNKRLFIENYTEYLYDASSMEELKFPIFYLTDQDDASSIMAIYFTGYEELDAEILGDGGQADYSINTTIIHDADESIRNQFPVPLYDGNPTYCMNNSHFRLNEVRIGIQNLNEINQDEIVLQNATVIFTDGTTQDIELGMIAIEMVKDSNSSIRLKQSHGWNANASSQAEVTENIIVQAVSDRHFEKMGNDFSVILNDFTITGENAEEVDHSMEGTLLEKGTELTCKGELKSKENKIRKYQNISLIPELIYTDEEGQIAKFRMMRVASGPCFESTIDVYRYLWYRNHKSTN